MSALQRKLNLHVCFGGNQAHRLSEEFKCCGGNGACSDSRKINCQMCLEEKGAHRIATFEMVNFKISCDGNWACLHYRKGELPNLLWRQCLDFSKSDIQSLFSTKWTMSASQKKIEFARQFWWRLGTPNVGKN